MRRPGDRAAMLRSLGLLLVLILIAACDHAAPVEARPALWRVADGDTTVWLLGTVHELPPRVRWRTPAIERAIADADTLVTEIPGAADHEALATRFAELARSPGLPPLAARLPPEERPALARAMAAGGLDRADLDPLESWAAATVLASAQARAAGATQARGIEPQLDRMFRDAGKTRLALESFEGQLAIFDTLPEDQQRLLLRRTLSAPNSYGEELAAWRSGNVEGLAEGLARSFAAAPALERALVTDRNARWSAWIARRMRRPGRVLVAVGAGHLAGARSVVAMLRARGLRVERVE